MLWLAACSSDTGRKDAGEAAVGAAPGSLARNADGGTAGRVGGVPIGPGFGALLGDHTGPALDEDKRRAVTAELQAMETGPSGTPVAWRNPETGRDGNVVPGPVTRKTVSPAGNTPTPCTSTAARRLSMAPLAGSQTGHG
jgi:surface antigen